MNSVTVSGIGELPYAMEEAVNRLRVNVGFFGENIRKIIDSHNDEFIAEYVKGMVAED